MYPYDIIFGMDLYDILISVGVVVALIIARYFADRDRVDAKLFNYILLSGCLSIVLGYFGAVITQAVYNWLGGAPFEISTSTGATFLGGLMGGAAVFLICYFVIGHFIFKNGENTAYFPRLLDFASVSITAAHGFGRLGCLMVGCCYGAETTAWYGIYHVELCCKVIPVQLYEAIFLFILCGILAVMVYKSVPGAMSLYMLSYGIWRFIIEYFRSDDRGSTIVSFLTPSQLTSVIMILGSILVFVYTNILSKRKATREVSDEKDQ